MLERCSISLFSIVANKSKVHKMKNKALPTVTEMKQALIERLITASKNLDAHDKMQIAINLKKQDVVVALITIERYTSGDAEEVRNLELAEKIAEQAEAICATKKSMA